MSDLKTQFGSDSVRLRRKLTGTPLIHYGPAWDAGLEATRGTSAEPVAVLVCHGMGQQVRYETISQVAEAIRTEAAAQGGTVSPVEVHLSECDGTFLSRAELQWTDAAHAPHAVHVYEAYWAPLTEGRVTYWDTIKFLFSAAANGLWYSRPFGPRRFQRWIFGGPKPLNIQRSTFPALLCVLAFVLLQVAIIGFVFLNLAAEYKAVIAQPLPVLHFHDLWHPGEMILHNWLHWLGPFFPGHAVLLNAAWFSRAWWWALVKLFVWFVVIGEGLVARYFIIEYVGDVAAYISPYKDSKFDEIRQKIQNVGLTVGKVIYGFGSPLATVPRYGKIVVAGHSLGSVLAYDTLNALINQDNVSAAADQRGVISRTRALVTFGSPLDKTAFIFRMQARDSEDWIREQLAASAQPLIVDYTQYRPATFEWVNIWSSMDIISGELNYYDDPALPPNHPPCVQNMTDPRANIPIYAHIQYWNNPTLGRQLYRFVS